MQYPVECVVFSKHFYTFVVFPLGTDIFDESVLLLSLIENLENVIVYRFNPLYVNKIVYQIFYRRNNAETKLVF